MSISRGTPVNVVLGGGGGKGFIHVGILEEIASHNLHIQSIVGTSVGAMIGALFAHRRTIWNGKKDPLDAQRSAVESVKNLCLSEDFGRFKDYGPFPFARALFKGEAIEDWLKTQLWIIDQHHSARFEDLDCDLTITATDAHTGESLILNKEREPSLYLYQAVRASLSIPGLFREFKIDVDGRQRTCWDGGTSGNCRFDVAHRLHPNNLTIASSLTYRGEPTFTGTKFLPGRVTRLLNHTADVFLRNLEQIVWENLSPEARKRIILVTPNIGRGSTYRFNVGQSLMNELFRNGRSAMGKILSRSQEGNR